ncbi:MAG: autotransporter domain-containing protein [Rhodospirillaceae bacterium]|nr:autotransporter domain-containing protein [Rhodospirillaceae bacterium]
MSGRATTFKKFGSYLALATAVSSLTVKVAHAGDLTISTARTTSASTLAGDGNGPGDIIVESAGSIAVSDPSIITLNSNNTITNRGTLDTKAEQNASGILVDLSQNRAGNVQNFGQLTVQGPQAGSALLNSPVNNAGIRLSGPSTFTGAVINDVGGIIGVAGNGSAGIAIESTLIGDLTNNGVLNVAGADSYAVKTTGHIIGNFNSSGAITATNTNGVGIYIGGGIEGAYVHSGTITAGNPEQLVSPDGIRIERTAPLPAKAGVWVASSLTDGFGIAGNGYTVAQQQVDATAAAALPIDATIDTYGPGPAVLISQGGPSGPQNIVIGRRGDNEYSFINQGILTTSGAIAGTNAVTINIEGQSIGGTVYTTTLTNGFSNAGGDINSYGLDATATGIRIGNYTTVPTVNNSGDINAITTDSTTNTATGVVGTKGGSAYGIVIESGAQVRTVLNSGKINATSDGGAASSYGVVDRSGSVVTFGNAGDITAKLATGSTGEKIAVDFRANTAGAAFNNTGNITGDVLLGGGYQALTMSGTAKIDGTVTFQSGASKTGASVVDLNGGTITGRINLGNGNGGITLAGASAKGGFTMGTGTLANITVSSSEVSLLSAGPLRAESAQFINGSRINFDISGKSGAPLLSTNGNVTISGDTKLVTTITGILEGRQVYNLIDAGTLTLGAPLAQMSEVPVSYMNNIAFGLAPNDPTTLQLTVERRSAAALGLGPNMTAVYDSLAPALNQDSPVATALSGLATQADFNAGLKQLMPDSSGAVLQTALSSTDATSGMIRRRLLGVAKGGAPDHSRGDIASFWVQALGNYGDQKGKGEQNGFSYWGLGIALGADFPIDRSGNTTAGVSFVESWHSVSLNVATHSPVQFYSTQLHAYAHHQSGNLYVQGLAGGAYNTYDQPQRAVTFGGLDRKAVGKWSGFQYEGSVEAGYLFRSGLYEFGPYGRLSYLNIKENAYTETGGGAGVNLAVDDRKSDSLRGTAGFAVNRNIPLSYDSYIEAQLRGGYTREFMNDPVSVSARFVSGGPTFTNLGNVWGQNRMTAGFGVAHKDSYSSVSLDYDAEVASGFLSHTAAVTIRFRF